MCEEMERYALVVTVTDRENLESRLYTEVRERLQEKVRVRVQQ